jgi:hypothetical protein
MRLVAIVFFASLGSASLVTLASFASLGCGHAEEPKPPVPLQPIDITGPREVVQALNLGAMDGLVVTRKNGTMLDEQWTVSAKATDEAVRSLTARGCTAEHHCSVQVVTSKE